MNTAPPVTPFQRRVYGAISRIPPGRVATYAEVAKAVNCRSCRAIGQALRRNPFAPDIPCHRVIASDLTPGGYSGRRNGKPLLRKLALLKKEGVVFTNGRLAEPAKLCTIGAAPARTPATEKEPRS